MIYELNKQLIMTANFLS